MLLASLAMAVPSDDELFRGKVMAFVKEWNAWAALYNQGVRDVKNERRVVRAWKGIEGELVHD